MEEIGVSTPRGLRGFGSNDKRFQRFFSIVQDAAKELGCVFFCWAGEGNELETDTMDGEDLSGWLVPKELSDEFEAQWEDGLESIDDKFDKFDVFARWTADESGNVSIRFEQ